jgi:hypothetical protein
MNFCLSSCYDYDSYYYFGQFLGTRVSFHYFTTKIYLRSPSILPYHGLVSIYVLLIYDEYKKPEN